MIDGFDQDALTEMRRNLLREGELCTQLAGATERAPGDDALADCSALLAMASGARNLALRIGQVLEVEPPLKIAVVGDYSAGKSSFINHLLGDDTLCPVRDDPTTSHVTVFGYGAEERIVRISPGGRGTKLTREQYVQQVQSSGTHRSPGKPRRFIIAAPIPVLKGIELLDTPGFNNLQNAGDTEVTEDVLDEVDAVLFLVDVNTGTIPESGAQRLRTIRSLFPQVPIRVMFTKSDAKAPGRLRTLKEDCQQRHGQLFDGEVLAYSTRDLGQRPDIASREAMAALFRQTAAFRLARERQLLTHDIRLHLRQRAPMLLRIEPRFGGLIEMQRARTVKANRSKARIRERFDRLQSDMASVYQSEVREALRASFRVKEIDGTGWFFKDARIVHLAPALPVALTTFGSVLEIRERMRSDTRRFIYEATEPALESVDATCAEAMADTAGRAEKLMAKSLGHLCNKTYDFDTTASEKLSEALAEHSPAIANALWEDWVLWIDGLYEIFEDEYLTPITEDAEDQVQALQGLLNNYRGLVLEAAATTMEYAR
jgi:GTPase SAR1 family protein